MKHWSKIIFALCLSSALSAADITSPIIYGHRGDREFGLQNTMQAFKAVWENGGNAVEIDVRTTADGKIVVFHDADLQKMAGDKRQIRKITYAELQKVDIGSRKHPMFKNEHPPLLEEFFAAMPKTSFVIVEIKKGAVDENFPYVLRDLLKKYNIARSQVTVVSFEEEPLRNLNKKVPGFRNMLIAGLGDCRRFGMKKPSYDPNLAADNILAKLKELGCTGFSFGAGDKRIKYDKKFFKRFIDAGYEISVWTVNDTWEAYKLVKLGASSVVTDRPTTMRHAWQKLFSNSQK